MTQKYDLIHLNGFVYVVDRKTKIYQDDWIYRDVEVTQANDEWIGEVDNQWQKIIMSSDPSLGLPLLPAVEEDISTEAVTKGMGIYTAFATDDNSATALGGYQRGYKDGYKAAKAKKYSEEDMLEAIVFGQQQSLLGKAITPTDITKEKFDKFLQSLNPLPIAVEVEMKNIGQIERGPWGEKPDPYWVPKVDANNIITVTKWIY